MIPLSTILACSIDIYHEQGNMIITKLLLPLGHISNSVPIVESMVPEVSIPFPWMTSLVLWPRHWPRLQLRRAPAHMQRRG